MENPKFEQYEVKIHPLALVYPEMPRCDFEGLKQSIREYGLKDPIGLWEGRIIDGRHRYKALCELESEEAVELLYRGGNWWFPSPLGNGNQTIFIGHNFDNEEQVKAFVTARNLHRRHLTPEQKRTLVEATLIANPERSNRQIATETKTSHTFVAKVREEGESAGTVATVATIVGKDGVQQPATKPTKPQAAPQADPLQSFFDDNGEIQAHVPDKPAFLDTLATVGGKETNTPDWRVRVKELLLEISRLTREAKANTPNAEIFETEALLNGLDSLDLAVRVALRIVTDVKMLPRMTEEEAVEFLQEDEEELAVEICSVCGQQIPADLLGYPVEDEEHGTVLLESGIYVVTPDVDGMPVFYFCEQCGSGRREGTFEAKPEQVEKCASCKQEIPSVFIDVVEKEHGDSARLESGVMLTREEEGNLYYCPGCAEYRWKSLTEQKVLTTLESLGGYKVGERVGWREHGLDHREGDKVRYGTIVACGKAIWRGSTPQGDFQLRERFYFDIDFEAQEFDKGGIRRCERSQVFHVGVDMAQSEELAVDALRVEPHVINTMLGQVSLENHLQSPVWCESMQKAMQDWFDCMLDSEEDAAERRIENYVRSWTAPLTPEQSNQYAEAHSLLILCRGEKRHRAEQSEQQEEPAPMFAEIQDRGEGMLFGMAPAKQPDNSLDALLR